MGNIAAAVEVVAAAAGAASMSDPAETKNEELAKSLYQQVALAAQAYVLVFQAASLAVKRGRDLRTEGQDATSAKVRRSRDFCDKTGRGNALLGFRATYVCGVLRRVYDNIPYAHHPVLFSDEAHLGPMMIDHTFDIVKGG